MGKVCTCPSSTSVEREEESPSTTNVVETASSSTVPSLSIPDSHRPLDINDVIKMGLLIGTPRACMDIEEFLSHQHVYNVTSGYGGYSTTSGAHSCGGSCPYSKCTYQQQHCNISFVSFHVDSITEHMFGMSPEDFIWLSSSPVVVHPAIVTSAGNGHAPHTGTHIPFDPSIVPGEGASHHLHSMSQDAGDSKQFYVERNPFAHLDEVGVGSLLCQCVQACRRLKPSEHHLMIGFVGDIVCSDPM